MNSSPNAIKKAIKNCAEITPKGSLEALLWVSGVCGELKKNQVPDDLKIPYNTLKIPWKILLKS